MEWQYIKRRLMEKAPAQKQHPQRHQRLHPRWYQPQLTMMMFIMIQYNCKQNFQKDKFTYCIAIGSVMIVKKHQNLNHFDDLEARCWLVLLANPCGHICYIIWKIKTLKGKLGETFLSGQSLTPLGEVYYTVYKRVLSSYSPRWRFGVRSVWCWGCKRMTFFIYWMTVALLAFLDALASLDFTLVSEWVSHTLGRVSDLRI